MEPITLSGIAQAIVAIIGAVGAAYGAWQKIKRGQSDEAYEQTQATIAALALAIETAPIPEAQKKDLKKNIHWLATQLDTEETVLKPAVAEITKAAKDILAAKVGDRLDKQGQLEAVTEWKRRRSSETRVPPLIPVLLFAVVLAGGLSGCATCHDASGLTQTTVVSPDPDEGTPALVIVAWPNGISTDPDDFVTTQTSAGVMVTVAPLVGSPPDEAPPEEPPTPATVKE